MSRLIRGECSWMIQLSIFAITRLKADMISRLPKRRTVLPWVRRITSLAAPIQWLDWLRFVQDRIGNVRLMASY